MRSFTAPTGWPDQGLAVDVAAHAGSLVAVIFWLRRDVAALAGAAAAAAVGRAHEGRRLLGHLLAASVPACAAGAALAAWGGEGLRGLETIAWTTTLGAVLLYVADRFAPARRRLAAMTLRDALLVGCAQALALVPGTSRAGITVTAARALGYARLDAMRFSMLLSIPVILGAGGLQAFELAAAGGDPGRWRDLALAAAPLGRRRIRRREPPDALARARELRALRRLSAGARPRAAGCGISLIARRGGATVGA